MLDKNGRASFSDAVILRVDVTLITLQALFRRATCVVACLAIVHRLLHFGIIEMLLDFRLALVRREITNRLPKFALLVETRLRRRAFGCGQLLDLRLRARFHDFRRETVLTAATAPAKSEAAIWLSALIVGLLLRRLLVIVARAAALRFRQRKNFVVFAACSRRELRQHMRNLASF